MSARFQIIHFEPDPFSGTRVPVAALVELPNGISVTTGWIPGPRCLGGEQASATVRLVLEALRASVRLGELPMSVGPQVQLGAVGAVPEEVPDAVAWVKENVLPRRPIGDQNLSEHSPLGPQRATVGYRFFETWHVDQFVRRRYVLEDVPGWSHPQVAPDVSHYVPGARQVLLMEPLIATRESFERELEQVGRTFLAWRGLQKTVSLAKEPTLVTYLQGSSDDSVMETKRALSPFVDRVFNVDQPGDRGEFLKLIRGTAATLTTAPLLQ